MVQWFRCTEGRSEMKKRRELALWLTVCLIVGLSMTAYAGSVPALQEPAAQEQAFEAAPQEAVPAGNGEEGESAGESAAPEGAGESPEGDSPGGESAGGDSPGGGMPNTSMGGAATSRPPDNSTRAINLLGERAAVYVEYTEDGYQVSQHLADSYEVQGTDIAVPETGKANTIDGLYIQCNAVDWDEEGSVGNSGLVINALTDTETTFVLGGKEDHFDAPDGEAYNSLIIMNVDENEEYDQSATETAAGCGIAFNGRSLLLENTYVESSGKGRPSIHVPASTRDKNVSQLSDLICVDSRIVNHSTRAMLLMGGDVWFLNSIAVTDSWGALSYDNTATTMYVVNSRAENTGTAYAIYDAAGCTAHIYGSQVISGGTGITVCRDATLTVDKLAAADAAATDPYTGTDDLLTPKATADGKSIVVGYAYPIKIHADMSGPDSVASAYLKDTYLSSQAEDVKLLNGEEPVLEGSGGGSIGSSAMNALVNEFQSGEIVEIACHNGKVEFDNCELNSRTGVLVHSFFSYDPMASGIYPIDGAEYAGDEVVLKNMSAQGDILHDDYMRKMTVSLENAELTGKVTGQTLTGWNNYGRAQIEAIGGDEEDETLVIHDETYETLWGVRMSMDAGSVWNVTGTSQLYSFTMEDGAQVQAAEGKALSIYVDCPMGNDLECYDISAGTQIEAFEPGASYQGVVIVAE